MKKLATLLVIGVVAFMYSCGPSAKELEEKRIADSIKVADSMAMVMAEQQRVADSIAKVQMEKMKIGVPVIDMAVNTLPTLKRWNKAPVHQ